MSLPSNHPLPSGPDWSIPSDASLKTWTLKLGVDSLPAGYTLMQQQRPSGQFDKYLYGHPSGGRFRSPAEFLPHWLFLKSNQLEPPCECKLCKTGKSKSVTASSLKRTPTGDSRIDSSDTESISIIISPPRPNRRRATLPTTTSRSSTKTVYPKVEPKIETDIDASSSTILEPTASAAAVPVKIETIDDDPEVILLSTKSIISEKKLGRRRSDSNPSNTSSSSTNKLQPHPDRLAQSFKSSHDQTQRHSSNNNNNNHAFFFSNRDPTTFL
ncbi:hypothetical protein BDR26DRAFT_195342 [Obelidium mucronatum]|nr:hypothetical protein BDR26DRAFT_195342 [Obelidium mucronatum]